MDNLIVIPAQAGTYLPSLFLAPPLSRSDAQEMGPRLRGDDGWSDWA